MSHHLRVSRDEIEYSDDSDNDGPAYSARDSRRSYDRTGDSGSGSGRGGDYKSEYDRDSRHSHRTRDSSSSRPPDDRGYNSRDREGGGAGGSRESKPSGDTWGERRRPSYEEAEVDDDYRGSSNSRLSREPRANQWEDRQPAHHVRQSSDPRSSTATGRGARAWNDATKRSANKGFSQPKELSQSSKSAIVIENVEDSDSDDPDMPRRRGPRFSGREPEEGRRSKAFREPPAEDRPKYPLPDRDVSMRSSAHSDIGAKVRASRDYPKNSDEEESNNYSSSRRGDERDSRDGRSSSPLKLVRAQLVREDDDAAISLSEDSGDDSSVVKQRRHPPEIAVAQPMYQQSSSFGITNTTGTTVNTTVKYSSPEARDRYRSNAERQNLSSYVLTAHESGGYTDLVQCLIVRDKPGVLDNGGYSLFIEDTNKHILYAQKKTMSRTANYHIFDMTRPTAGKTLSKKSGNYLGKLRALNLTSTDYVLVTAASEREEVAAMSYDQVSLMDQMKEGSQPRRINVMVPTLDSDSIPVPNHVGRGVSSMIDLLKSSRNGKMFVFSTKEPKYENGNYRLNFHGRVSVPSVKNFQLCSSEEPDHIICQFGKIGEDRFHLDFKAPLNAFQAFAIALSQFNI